MKRTFKKLREYLPLGVIIIFFFALAALAVHITAIYNSSFADFYSRYIGSYLRAALAYLTMWLPFSLAEAILLLVPVIFTVLIIYSFRIATFGKKRTVRFITSVFSATLVLYSIFVFGFGTGYYGSTIDKKMNLIRSDVSAEELRDTAILLQNQVNALAGEINFSYNSSSYSPYSINETSDLICNAYKSIYEDYSFITPLYSHIKPIILSVPLTYTHIAGVYSYFTGEANINTNFPDYNLPYTIAHEFAHQRGIAREDEANFVAYIVCIASDDPYVRYSGYLNMYEYVTSALYSADSEMYYSVLETLDTRVRYELVAYSDFFDKYRDSVAADVSGTINDTYLKIQGTEGTKSYGLVVDLTVAYYKYKIN